jgi:hypothetical protein
MMQSELMTSQYTKERTEVKASRQLTDPVTDPVPVKENYDRAERQFIQLLDTENLDQALEAQAVDSKEFEQILEIAIATAYQTNIETRESSKEKSASDAAHLFLQRILYRINRLKLFWYDDLRHYTNERSSYLREIRDRIENAWQQWEAAQFDRTAYQQIDVKQALIERTTIDVDPPISEDGIFFRDQVGEAGYRLLVMIASLDGLVEASQLSRTLGGVANEVHSVLTRLLVEEYGAGRLGRKHSSYFMTMLEELGLQTEPEAYFNVVPWEVLAIINHSFLLTERKRFFLRYIGGLLYGELTVPASFRHYQAAGRRLGLSDSAMSYWNLHIKVDELHGQWMLNDVTLPLIKQYPDDAWEMVFGYDQQRLLSDRAGVAVAQAVRAADGIR